MSKIILKFNTSFGVSIYKKIESIGKKESRINKEN